MEITGRVLACPKPDEIIVADGAMHRRVQVTDADVRPGDLVRVTLAEGGHGAELAAAMTVERVFRPRHEPFGPETETTALLSSGRLTRLTRRAEIVAAVRAHFATQGSLEVETPTMATSPGLDLHLHAFEVTPPIATSRDPDQSGRRTSVVPFGLPYGYLITSPEYHMKRLLAGGVRRCHQFARCFRANESGARHEPEFTMLEWYRAWDDMDAMLRDTLAVVRAAAQGPELTVRGRSVRLDAGEERLTVREAFARWAPDVGDPIDLAGRDEDRYFGAIVDRVEPHLGRDRPTFLTHFPARHASLARLSAGDASVCDRFELYVGGVELSNGFVELTDPVEQRARLERDQRDRSARGLPVYPIDARFLAALEEGMPPSVGNALGFDRLVALVLGRESIADVIAFPAARR